MAGRIDSASAGAEIVNAYDSQIDSLMDAIAAYVGRSLPTDGTVHEDGSLHLDDGSGTILAATDDPNVWTDGTNSYVYDADRERVVCVNVNVGGRELDASTVEDPGFGLLSAAAVNDGTSNIGLATKLIMDQAGWAKQISRATQG